MKLRRFSSLPWAITLGVMCGVIRFAPAHGLAMAVSSMTHGQVQLRDAKGTLWQGDAQWVLTSGEGGREAAGLPSRLSWQMQWVDVLSWQWQFQADCCLPQPLRLTFAPSWRGFEMSLQGGASQWPLRWLGGLGAPWNTVGLGGRLVTQQVDFKVAWRPLDSRAMRLEGKVALEMAEVTSDLSTVKPLGHYRVMLMANDQVSIDLKTLQGHLNLQGQGTWTAKGLRFEGLAQAAQGYEAALMNVLGVLGPRSGPRTVLKWG